MQRKPSIEELVARACCGDQSAAAEIVHRHEPCLLAYLERRIKGRSIARLIDPEDVAEEVWTDFFRPPSAHLHFRRARDVDHYLAKLGFRRLNDFWRDYGWELGLRCELERAATCLAREPDAVKELGFRELVAWLRRRIPKRPLTMLILRAFGARWQEIGIRLRLPAGTARMQFERVRERIQRALETWIS
jgi:DNA-directed RNA polymerase specialized sigma24 family protein